MILPGSDSLLRYPSMPTVEKRGIPVYGTTKDSYGRRVYKVPRSDSSRAQRLGYSLVKEGTGYAYIFR